MDYWQNLQLHVLSAFRDMCLLLSLGPGCSRHVVLLDTLVWCFILRCICFPGAVGSHQNELSQSQNGVPGEFDKATTTTFQLEGDLGILGPAVWTYVSLTGLDASFLLCAGGHYPVIVTSPDDKCHGGSTEAVLVLAPCRL